MARPGWKPPNDNSPKNPIPSFNKLSIGPKQHEDKILSGKVVRWNAGKGCGAIICNTDQTQYFFHISEVVGCRWGQRSDASASKLTPAICNGCKVRFERGRFDAVKKSFRVTKVTVVGKAEPLAIIAIPSANVAATAAAGALTPGVVAIFLASCPDRSVSYRQEALKALDSPRSLLKPKLEQWNGARVYLSKDGSGFMLEYNAMNSERYFLRREIQALFNKVTAEGHLDWLSGKKGWRWSNDESFGGSNTSRQDVTDALNKLQDVFKTLTMNVPELRYRQGKKEMWNKSPIDLPDAVHDIRIVFEVIRFFDEEGRPTDKEPGILSKWGTGKWAPSARWGRIMRRVRVLLRTSRDGPDAPIQWAAHAPLNSYPLAVVTRATQLELIDGLISILKDLLYGNGIEVDANGKHPTPFPGVGTVWRTSSQRRKKDWANHSKNQVKGFETEDSFERLLNSY